ncbi:laminin G domain-containing protein [Longispora sp. NPDC051575]|uniref:laminin G domain-containing protein n=1 Tax=Longispora sp. NPDC051575 TaxID=3154943 RepID=UPI003417992E
MHFRHFAAVTGMLFVVLASDAAVADGDPWEPLATYQINVGTADADGDALVLRDASGHGHDLSAHTSRGGAITLIRDGDRPRLRFPAPCADADRHCPHAILQGGAAEDLNPGERRLRFGATLRMSPAETTDGSNILQKGYSLQGSQYKLQVDGFAGHPSCVFVEDGPIWMALSDTGVADGRWHDVACERDGGTLTVTVDGARTGQITIPADLSVENDEPLRLGGKDAGANNDQFSGELAAAFVSVAD